MKSLIESTTFWFGFVQIVLGIFGYALGILDPTTSSTLVITGFGTIGFRLGVTQQIGSVFPKA